VHFGAPKAEAVAALSALLGAPGGRGANTGCSPRYTEVVWGDLAVEFRSSRFSGYRYVEGGFPITTPGSPHAPVPKGVTPNLATAKGITLGSTLAQVRAVYTPLRRVATDGWKATNKLWFGDDAKRDPIPPTSRIVEIKIGTCGDF
jgi:hypothetical protein